MTSSYFFVVVFFFLLFVLFALLAAIAEEYVCMSSTCSLFLYRAMYVSFHCCRSLAHIDIVIEHNEKEKGERNIVLFIIFLFPPIHLSFALVNNDDGAAALYRRK
jgi:hypothetical protein